MRNFNLFILCIFLCIGYASQAQTAPAQWTLEVQPPSAKVGQEVALVFKVSIDKDWFLYSTDFDRDLGPMLTEFQFAPDKSYALLGGIQPIGAKKKYDPLWEGEYTYFEHTAKFVQKIKILKARPQIKGSYAYQVCTYLDGKCIPFEDDFDFSLYFK